MMLALKGPMHLHIFNRAAPIVEFAFWLGVAVAAMTVVMMAATLTMRRVALRRERIYAAAVALWRPIIVAEPGGAATDIPSLSARDRSGFIRVWNDVHESLRGGTTGNLVKIARAVGLDQHLYRSLQSATFHDRVMAVIALGHLRSVASFGRVAQYLDDKSPIMSLCTARALMQIDPERAAPQLVPRIVERSDWSQGSIAAILQEESGAIVSGQLTEATLKAEGEVASRLIRLLAGVSPASAAPIICDWLRSSADEHLVSTCLQVMSNQADLDSVRPLLAHPRWHIRMQAATTLGRLGIPGDEQRLVGMLSDTQWWVRYRAAGGLLNLSFVGTERLRQIQRTLSDAYARDIITHVLAELALEEAS
jgi:hypothetical protein